MPKSRRSPRSGAEVNPSVKGEHRGRPKGTPNKVTRLIKEAAMEALDEVGYPMPVMIPEVKNGKRTGKMIESGKFADGPGGLKGYLKYMAMTDLKAMASLLGRILPMQVSGRIDVGVEHKFTTVEELRDEMRKRGLPEQMMPKLISPPDDDEEGDVINLKVSDAR